MPVSNHQKCRFKKVKSQSALFEEPLFKFQPSYYKWSSYYILVIQSISPLSRFRSSCSQVKFSRVTIVSMSRILSAPKTTKPRTTPFQAAHCVQYGLKIVERHPQKQDVTGVRCRFCLHFGREDKVVQQEPSR